MNNRFFLIALVLLGCSSFMVAQSKPTKAKKETIATVLDDQLKGVEKAVVGAADAMPEDKYSFKPSGGEFKDVRTFAEQVKHVACANFAFFDEIEHKDPPPNCETGGPAPARTKSELLKYLRDSFSYGDRVVGGLTPANTLDPVDGP